MIELVGNARGMSGYAHHMRNLLIGLRRIGAEIKFTQTLTQRGMDFVDNEAIDAIRYFADNKALTTQIVFMGSPSMLHRVDKNMILYFPWEPLDLPEFNKLDLSNSKFYNGESSAPAHFTNWSKAMEETKAIIATSSYTEEVYKRCAPGANILGYVYPPVCDTMYKKLDTTPVMEAEELNSIKDYYKILLIGKWEPRKNILDTVRILLPALSGKKAVIIIKTANTGNPETDTREIGNLIKKYCKELPEFRGMELPQILLLTEPSSDIDMNILYNFVDLTIMATHAEGFGYPAAESIFSGTDVLCTNGSALQEVVNFDKEHLIPADIGNIVSGNFPLFHGTMRWFYPRLQVAADMVVKRYEAWEQTKAKRDIKYLMDYAKSTYSVERSAEKFMTICNNIG